MRRDININIQPYSKTKPPTKYGGILFDDIDGELKVFTLLIAMKYIGKRKEATNSGR